MTKTIALILALGAAAPALAQPFRPYEYPSSAAPVYEPPRYQRRPIYIPPAPPYPYIPPNTALVHPIAPVPC